MKFVQAANYTPVGNRKINLIVIHDMEAPEKSTTAEGCAAFFHNQPRSNNGSSAHYCVDNDSIVQCVHDMDVAWHAPGANHDGIGIEHAGYARQTREQWLDAYGKQMLGRSAKLTAGLCKRYKIPVRWMTAKGLQAGLRGITGHADVTAAYHRSTHTDPGPNFPKQLYLEIVRSELANLR
jgi:N-acetyl-anhydromuramyl-L-alanine amidase AmpD